MPTTPIVWLLLFVACTVGALVQPFLGLAGYLLEYYQRPGLQWWGHYLPDWRWNFIIASVFAVAFLLRRGSLPPVREVRNTAGILLFAQCLNMALVYFWAIAPELSSFWAERYWKTVIIYFLIIGVVRTRWAVDFFLLLNMAGSAWWGFDALDKKRTHARMEGIGSADTLNSNLLAAHLLTVLPAIVLFAWAERDRRWRLAALLCFPLVLNLFVLANSRGATLGLIATALAALALVRFGQRKRVVLGLVAVGLALFALADPQYVSRQQTTAEGEAAGRTRLELWGGAFEVIKDYPLGLGGRGFHIVSPRYVPDTVTEDAEMGRSAHNTYLQLTAEWGVQGLALFTGFLWITFRYLHRVRRQSQGPDWFYYRSLAIELGLIGTLVAGIFSVRFYGESVYWLAGLAFALHRMEREGPALASDVSGGRVIEGSSQARVA